MKAATVSGAPRSPSSRRWRGQRQVTRPAPPSSASAQRRRWRGPAAGAYVVVVPPGGRHGSVSAQGGQALKAAAAAHADGEAGDGPPASLLEQRGEAAVVVRLVVEVGVVRLSPPFDGRLKDDTEGGTRLARHDNTRLRTRCARLTGGNPPLTPAPG